MLSMTLLSEPGSGRDVILSMLFLWLGSRLASGRCFQEFFCVDSNRLSLDRLSSLMESMRKDIFFESCTLLVFELCELCFYSCWLPSMSFMLFIASCQLYFCELLPFIIGPIIFLVLPFEIFDGSFPKFDISLENIY